MISKGHKLTSNNRYHGNMLTNGNYRVIIGAYLLLVGQPLLVHSNKDYPTIDQSLLTTETIGRFTHNFHQVTVLNPQHQLNTVVHH